MALSCNRCEGQRADTQAADDRGFNDQLPYSRNAIRYNRSDGSSRGHDHPTPAGTESQDADRSWYAGDPIWQAVVRISGSRTFLTDGGLAIDAALAKPATLPGREVPGKVLETYFSAPHSAECSFADVKATASGKIYTTHNGLPLNATYVVYLRRILPRGQVRLRMSGDLQPVVIVADGKVLGVLIRSRERGNGNDQHRRQRPTARIPKEPFAVDQVASPG